MRIRLFRVSHLAMLLFLSFAASGDTIKPLHEFLNLYEEAASSADLSSLKSLEIAFDDLKRSGRAKTILGAASNDDLGRLASALGNLIRLSRLEGASQWLLSTVKELHTRGIAAPKDYEYAYKGLISERKFIEAGEFKRDFSLSRLPEVPRANFIGHKSNIRKPRFWEVGTDSQVLTQRTFEFSGPKVIVVTHPAVCEFSRHATQSIYSDSELRSKLMQNGLFLVPAFFGLHFDYIQEWNKEHSGNSLVIAHSEVDWPMLDLMTTPGFYFFMDEKLIDHVAGWPSEGNMEEFRAGLKAIGL